MSSPHRALENLAVHIVYEIVHLTPCAGSLRPRESAAKQRSQRRRLHTPYSIQDGDCQFLHEIGSVGFVWGAFTTNEENVSRSLLRF